MGLAAALALKERGITNDITILEAAPRATASFSDRNIALSASSWRFLSSLGVSVDTQQRAPIRQVEITQRGAFGLLTLDAKDVDAVELGAATPYPMLKSALDRNEFATRRCDRTDAHRDFGCFDVDRWWRSALDRDAPVSA